MSCVYFIKHRNIDGIKIGYSSKNTPEDRIAAMQTASPNGIISVGHIITKDAHNLEKKLHDKYKNVRLNGEWFDISLEEVNHIMNKFTYNNQSKLEEIRKISHKNN